MVEGEHISVNRWYKLIAGPPFRYSSPFKAALLNITASLHGAAGDELPFPVPHTQPGSPRQFVCSAKLPAGIGVVLSFPLQVSLQVPPHPELEGLSPSTPPPSQEQGSTATATSLILDLHLPASRKKFLPSPCLTAHGHLPSI